MRRLPVISRRQSPGIHLLPLRPPRIVILRLREGSVPSHNPAHRHATALRHPRHSSTGIHPCPSSRQGVESARVVVGKGTSIFSPLSLYDCDRGPSSLFHQIETGEYRKEECSLDPTPYRPIETEGERRALARTRARPSRCRLARPDPKH